MMDHDKVVGKLLELLDTMGLTDSTLVQYSTDNGPHMNTWPDAGEGAAAVCVCVRVRVVCACVCTRA